MENFEPFSCLTLSQQQCPSSSGGPSSLWAITATELFFCRIEEGCAAFRRMFRGFRNCVIGQWQINSAVPDQECFILDQYASGHSLKFQNVLWKNTSCCRVKHFQIDAVLPCSLGFTKVFKLKYLFLNRIGIGLSNRKTDVFRSSGNYKRIKFVDSHM